ncbi:hypothetical protein [Reinekea sp.]|jgi:sigma-E factor negative regulatory protein RseA|uniref:sigma-E factor negative regulatory protein n=1 Tax=Reinekea sp. TaxID=1970455 RepID=UPI002A7F5C4A|nr:hypothetical protein [Reinekea sp.]
MHAKANESFSAFLDGEASEIDVQRMLKALDDQPALLSQWHGLSKAKAGLQGEVLIDTALTFDAAVPAVGVAVHNAGWRLRLQQAGIAAAVALVVITGARYSLELQPSAPVLATVVTPERINNALAQQQFEAQLRLDLYLREHAEQASFTTGHVVVPAQLRWLEAQPE